MTQGSPVRVTWLIMMKMYLLQRSKAATAFFVLLAV